MDGPGDVGGTGRDLEGLVDALPLPDLQKRFLRARWLDQVVWMEGRAEAARRRHYALQGTAVLGGVVVPALVSLNVGDPPGALRWATVSLSLLVAAAVAVEGWLRFGERWRHYRATVERLKAEGWRYLQLGGPYARHGDHAAAYASFAHRVEGIIQPSVDAYLAEVAPDDEASGAGGERDAGGRHSG